MAKKKTTKALALRTEINPDKVMKELQKEIESDMEKALKNKLKQKLKQIKMAKITLRKLEEEFQDMMSHSKEYAEEELLFED